MSMPDDFGDVVSLVVFFPFGKPIMMSKVHPSSMSAYGLAHLLAYYVIL